MHYLDPATDSVWGEATALVERQIGGRIEDFDQARLFHSVLAETVDPPSRGGRFTSTWEQSPCPNCSSRTRRVFGPVEPIQQQHVRVAPVTHSRWDGLSGAQKHAVAQRLHEEWVRETERRRREALDTTQVATGPDTQLSMLCRQIASLNQSSDGWSDAALNERVQTDQYVGWYESAAEEFCFSYFAPGGEEYWFELMLDEVSAIAAGEERTVVARRVPRL